MIDADAPPPTHAPELLAPAGDWAALRAAVANGADAVYFGLERFNARRRAANFPRAALPDVLGYLHEHNVRGYITLNTLVFTDELPQAAEYAAAIAQAGADAVIVQDLGLIRLLRRLVPTLPIHASTQMTQTEAGGIELLRELGVRRVILARELTLAEIARLLQRTPMPVEVFVHGALCISYSGQCLASAALFDRSANRGLCAQPCRLPYQLVIDGQPRPRGARDYPLSPQDLAAPAHVAELVRLGVAAFKIEGRLKSASYVAATTRVYRAALDAARHGQRYDLSPPQHAELSQGFSRGFTPGFLAGVDHRALVRGEAPTHRGIWVGTVVRASPRGVLVELAAPAEPTVKPGDGVVFDAGRPDRDEQGGRVYRVEVLPQGAGAPRVLLSFGREDVDLATIPSGCRVWKTDDPALRRALEQTYRHDKLCRRVPLSLRAEIDHAGMCTVYLADDAGHEVVVRSEAPLRPAVRHPLSAELLTAQFARLGDTPFELVNVELVGPDGPATSLPWLAPKSVLNRMRRHAAERLRRKRAAAARHEIADPVALESLRGALSTQRETPRPPAAGAGEGVDAGAPLDDRRLRLHVLARTLDQLNAVLTWPRPSTLATDALVYCDFRSAGDYARAVSLARDSGRAIGLATPRIIMPGEERELEQIVRLAPDAVLVRNLAALRFLRCNAPHVVTVADQTLNIANELAALVADELGLTRLTPAYELSETQLANLLAAAPPAWFEIVVHTHIPIFHTRHCLYAAALSDGARCGDCGWRCFSHTMHLRDRAGALHPVLPDSLGRNTVYHATPQSAPDRLSRLWHAGVHHFRVELLSESPADVVARLQDCAALDFA